VLKLSTEVPGVRVQGSQASRFSAGKLLVGLSYRTVRVRAVLRVANEADQFLVALHHGLIIRGTISGLGVDERDFLFETYPILPYPVHYSTTPSVL
jgi:hypothetical protein